MPDLETRGIRGLYGYLQAARVGADGGVHALWDCAYDEPEEQSPPRGGTPDDSDFDTYVTYYGPGADSEDFSSIASPVDSSEYGEDLELGPNGDPYVLAGSYTFDDNRADISSGTSNVTHFTAADLDEVGQLRCERSAHRPGRGQPGPAGGVDRVQAALARLRRRLEHLAAQGRPVGRGRLVGRRRPGPGQRPEALRRQREHDQPDGTTTS